MSRLQDLTDGLGREFPDVDFTVDVEHAEFVVRWDNRTHPDIDENVVVDLVRRADLLEAA